MPEKGYGYNQRKNQTGDIEMNEKFVKIKIVQFNSKKNGAQ
jgi:hypothetical protein